jgi:uncharacterized membrane protein YbhN (UPF0104 family)
MRVRRLGGSARIAAGFASGLAAAGFGAWLLGVKPELVLRDLTGVSPWAVALCVASSMVVLALQALRWHAVMLPLLGLKYADAFRAMLTGVLFNAFLPARGGDLVRVQYLGRRTGKSRATILGTEIVDRWLDMWGWLAGFLLLCAVSDPPQWLYRAVPVGGGLLLVWAGIMVVLARTGRGGKIWSALRDGIGAFRSRRTWAVALLIAPLPWLWESLVIMQASRGFAIELTWMKAFSVMCAFNLAMFVPSPGAVGTVEVGGTAALLFFGVDQSRALAFMFAYHFSQLLPGIAGGAAVLVAQGEKLLGRAQEGLGPGL